MNRKLQTSFIYLLCLVITLAISIFPPQIIVNSQPKPASAELRGVWLTNVASGVLFVPWGVNRALHQLSQLNFNTVYPVVWNRGHTFYPSPVAKHVMGSSQDSWLWLMRLGGDVLAEIVQQGKQQGLRVIPWFEYGFMAPAGSELAKSHPQWITGSRERSIKLQPDTLEEELLNSTEPNVQPYSEQVQKFIRNRAVSKTVWLNPLHPEVQEFILDLIVEVLTNYDVAGIQLDDHFGLPVDFGYDPFTVRLYQQEHQGKNPPVNPEDPEWMRWRADKITEFMQRVFQAVKIVKPDAIVSLSPNPQDFSYKAYLQDWQTWVKLGLVDELILQVYRDDMKTFLAQLSHPAVEIARQKIPVGVGILSGLWTHPVEIEQIKQQVKAVRDRGFNGVSFFYWESLWGYIAPESPRKRRAAFRALFPSRATQPKVLPSPVNSKPLFPSNATQPKVLPKPVNSK